MINGHFSTATHFLLFIFLFNALFNISLTFLIKYRLSKHGITPDDAGRNLWSIFVDIRPLIKDLDLTDPNSNFSHPFKKMIKLFKISGVIHYILFMFVVVTILLKIFI